MSHLQLTMETGDASPGPLKRKRASKPKVRTGCIVCKRPIDGSRQGIFSPLACGSPCSNPKIRRVKCDETKPACIKCTSTGRKCEGYEAQPGQLAASRRQKAEAEAQALQLQTTALQHYSSNKVAIPRSPSSTHIISSSSDAAASAASAASTSPSASNDSLDFFRLNILAAIERGSTYKLWTRVVVQLSHSVPAVRLAAAALGALSRRMQLIDTYRSRGALDLVLDEAASLLAVAENEYARALRELREHLGRSDDEAAEAGLVSCWLMYAFEFLRGNAQPALIHLVSGMTILQKYLQDTEARGGGAGNGRMAGLSGQIAKLFEAWDQRTAVWLGLEKSLMETISEAEDPGKMLEVLSTRTPRSLLPAAGFEGLEAAALAQRQIIISIMFLRHRLNMWLLLDDEQVSRELEAERRKLLAAVMAWRTAFDAYVGDHYVQFSVGQRHWATLLDVNGRAAYLRISAILQASEPEAYAPRAPELSAILDLAESLLAPENMMKCVGGGDSNTCGEMDMGSPAYAVIREAQEAAYFNLGLIQPLHLVAVKTQQADIRSRAIALLEADSWDEGGFSSKQAALLARSSTEGWIDSVGLSKEEMDADSLYYYQEHPVSMAS